VDKEIRAQLSYYYVIVSFVIGGARIEACGEIVLGKQSYFALQLCQPSKRLRALNSTFSDLGQLGISNELLLQE